MGGGVTKGGGEGGGVSCCVVHCGDRAVGQHQPARNLLDVVRI